MDKPVRKIKTEDEEAKKWINFTYSDEETIEKKL